MSGNDDKVQGTVDDVKGRAQEAVGDLTNNPDDKSQGQANQAKGTVEKTTGDLKNAVGDLTGNNDNNT